MSGLEFRLLGDVTAIRDGIPIFLGPARPRGVLAVLLLAADNPVSLDDIVERVWGGTAPKQARSSLHSYFTRLRTAFAGETDIVRHGHGYVLPVDPEAVDVHRFRRLAALGRESRQVRHFDEALALWRGEPGAGLESPWLDEVRGALRAEHESVLLDRAELKLELGQHAEILPDLTVRAGRNLLDERLAGQLMLALHRSGRQADALRHFQRVRTVLAEELGVDPGVALKSVHQGIVRDRTEVAVVPRQLPAAPRVFFGRKEELATLAESDLAVIVGPGGIGKTSLALLWAHENVRRFPDGQLYLNLAGVGPSVAMRNFLLALGIGPDAMPADQAALAGLYRSVLADKRMLIVLDNADNAEQVAALLPGGAACSVVVTSRNRLTSLVTFNNANLIGLDMLDHADAYAILLARLGSTRLEAEPAAVHELLAACGGLPLALSIIVGRAQEHPDFSLASLASEMRDAGLNAFEVDAELSIRAALAASVAALSPTQADLFALLGLAPGPDIGLVAAASLVGRTYASARTTLRALERGSLVQQHSPGRFRMHDLVRRYAAELAADRFPDSVRESALWRLSIGADCLPVDHEFGLKVTSSQ